MTGTAQPWPQGLFAPASLSCVTWPSPNVGVPKGRLNTPMRQGGASRGPPAPWDAGELPVLPSVVHWGGFLLSYCLQAAPDGDPCLYRLDKPKGNC